jgi:hypothetical protein
MRSVSMEEDLGEDFFIIRDDDGIGATACDAAVRFIIE